MARAGDEPGGAGPLVVHPGDRLPAGKAIVLEDAREMAVPATCRSIPLGYHRLVLRDGSDRSLIVTPGRCHEPPACDWGWAVQLYAARSRASWGIGDLGDLAALGRWGAGQRAGFLLINPLHAPLPRLPQQPSPYFPSSRLFRNPLYLRVESVPGARGDSQIQRLAARGRSLNAAATIDRDRVHALKMRALERLWARFSGDRRFDEFCARQGETLLRYACFCVLSEQRSDPWQRWPARYRRPDAAGVVRIAREQAPRVNFHRWLQWLLEAQLLDATRSTGVMHDLAIGFDPSGADAWLWQDVVAGGVRVGAPPDEFAPAGQDWGLPPFDPHRLRAAGYQPFIETVRSSLRSGVALRIDHVMGLFRLWWVPPDAGSAADGAYVRYPARELLDILALESSRAGAYVVGEDLGTVDPSMRVELRRRGVLSYRLAWFESRPPSRYPREAMAAITTHDLPTVAGVWTGADVDEQERSGRPFNLEAELRVRARLRRLTGGSGEAPAAEVIERAYAALAAAPSRLLSASLDDAAAAVRRPNLPGDMARPNWSIPLPRSIEQLRRDQLPQRIAHAMRREGAP